MNKVFFHYADRKLNFPDKNAVKSFVENIFTLEKRPLERLDYIFCSDEYLLNINKTYLQHDYYTDIITFNLSNSSEITGEIYISLDRVKDNAQTLQQPLKNEILRVIFHGALHLCGYNDKSKAEEVVMCKMEDKYIALFLKHSFHVEHIVK